MNVDLGWLGAQFPQLLNIQPLKAGGQKFVFSCEHPEYGATVLKLMRPEGNYYLDRELEAIKRLPANNVPEVYEIGIVSSQVGRHVFLFEQRVDGVDLSKKLKSGSLDRLSILSLAHDLVVTAAAAESVGVVHRDIKPDNIKIDTKNKAWLLDFGIARILDLDSKTATAAVYGPHTPGYSAPEQFRNRKDEITGKADLFAIGVVLYECSSGINPFLQGARDRLDVLNRVENLQLPQLDLPWDNDGKFADFVSALTQKYPHQRPPSCSKTLIWLEEFLDLQGGN